MRSPTALLLSLVLITFGAACGDAEADTPKVDTPKVDTPKVDTPKVDTAATAAAGEVALPMTGLKGDAPAGTNVAAMMGSDVVQAPDLVATVQKANDKPKTGEAAKAAADIHMPVDPKIETLADGYVLTFTNVGDAGTNYWVQARREIDGAAYWCSTTGSSQHQMDTAIAFCKSLEK